MKIVRRVVVVFSALVLLLVGVVLALYMSLRIKPLPPSVASVFAGKELAHRGGYEYGPENCLPHIKSLSQKGIKTMEVDLLTSKDGVLVLFHDHTINRVTNGKGAVKALTLKELQNVLIKEKDGKTLSSCKIATLNDYLKLVKQEKLLSELDLKHKDKKSYQHVAKEVSRLIKKHKVYDRVYVSSFDPRMLYQVRKYDPKIVTAYSFRTDATGNFWVDSFLRSRWVPSFLGVSILEPQKKLVTASSVKSWTQQGYTIVAWTANLKKDKERLKKLKVSFVSNCPGRVCLDHSSDH